MQKNPHTGTQKIVLIIITICIALVALNLRPNMAFFGPPLTQITNPINITYTQISLLTMLPVIAMGLGMFLGNRIKATTGLATVARLFYFDVTGLITTAIISGLGIAVIQALIPVFIKTNFTNTSLLMGFYATAIMGGATISASLTPWIANRLGSWQLGLAVWSILAIFGLIAWSNVNRLIKNPVVRQSSVASPICTVKDKDRDRFFINKRAWLLAIFFGLGTATYTCVLAWLAPFYLDLGFSDQQAGMLLALLTLLEVIAGLTIPVLSANRFDRRPYLLILLLCIAIGCISLSLFPLTFLLLWPVLLGIGIGGLFPMSLIVSMDHISNPQRSGNLTAFTQGIGYIIAGISPLIAGFIRSTTNSFQYSWLLLALIMLVMVPMALCFNPIKYYEKFE